MSIKIRKITQRGDLTTLHFEGHPTVRFVEGASHTGVVENAEQFVLTPRISNIELIAQGEGTVGADPTRVAEQPIPDIVVRGFKVWPSTQSILTQLREATKVGDEPQHIHVTDFRATGKTTALLLRAIELVEDDHAVVLVALNSVMRDIMLDQLYLILESCTPAYRERVLSRIALISGGNYRPKPGWSVLVDEFQLFPHAIQQKLAQGTFVTVESLHTYR